MQALLTRWAVASPQKSKNTKTGSEMQRDKDQVAAMMREKQKAGRHHPSFPPIPKGQPAAALMMVVMVV